jgi:hypothetical protein
MQLLRRILLILVFTVPLSAQADVLVVTGSSGGSAVWLALAVWVGLQPRPALEPSPYHISAPRPTPARDACTFVAGVRHCPLPKPNAGPNAGPR